MSVFNTSNELKINGVSVLGLNLSTKVALKSADYLKFAGKTLLCQTLPQALPIKPLNLGGLKLAEPLQHDIFALNPIKAPEKLKTIEEIQAGIMGKIRTPEELSTKDIMRLIEHQLSSIKADDIEKVLIKFPKEDKDLALKAMKRLTQFGNMESLNTLVKNAMGVSTQNHSWIHYINFLDDQKASLSHNLRYLSNKNIFPYPDSLGFAFQEGNYIVDEMALEHLETDKTFLKMVKKEQIELIYPEGWVNGINPYNQTDDLFEKVHKIVSEVKELKGMNFSEDNALYQALNGPIHQRLSKLGLSKRLHIIQNDSTKEMPNSVRSIVSQLKPTSISKETLDKNLSYLTTTERQAALEVLARGMHVESPKSLSESLQKMHSEILKQNKGTLDGVYYMVPGTCKSYSYMTMQYMLTNKIPASKILYFENNNYYTKLLMPSDCKKIVLVDDAAISGDSIRSIVVPFKDKIPNVDFIVAPVVSHKGTKEQLQLIKQGNLRYKTTCIPQKECDTVTKTDYFNSLDQKSQELIFAINGVGGYSAHQKTNLAFPWMSPDNNNAFFANVIAPFFTLNQRGVKINGGWFKPSPNFAFQKGELLNL